MAKNTRKNIVLVLSLSLLLCLTATSCLTFLGSVVGEILFRFSDFDIDNRHYVYGEGNDIGVTFSQGKMYAIWDADGAAKSLNVVCGEKSKTYDAASDGFGGGKIDLTKDGFSYRDDLSLTLTKGVSAKYFYDYHALTKEQYEEFTSPVEAGFEEIDYYAATRAEWFDLFSYLVVFREGAEEIIEDGQTVWSMETKCCLAYDFVAYDEYDGLETEEAFANELYSAIDAYEDSASYAYGYELEEDGRTATLYLKFYYDNAPIYETDSYSKYYNATRLSDPVHYRLATHIRHLAIDDVEKTVPVSCSDQLYFALKQGYRPLPEKGSRAETLYNRMRYILGELNADGDSDYDKAHRIYDCIVNTTVYDYSFTEDVMNDSSKEDDLFLYKCLYIEGVLGWQNNGTFSDQKRVAICDGLSKTYLCLAVMEGIGCYKISGTVSGAGHAWNKVRLDGEWYLVDTTWGNDKEDRARAEYLRHDYFLVADDAKHVETPYISYPAAPKKYTPKTDPYTGGVSDRKRLLT